MESNEMYMHDMDRDSFPVRSVSNSQRNSSDISHPSGRERDDQSQSQRAVEELTTSRERELTQSPQASTPGRMVYSQSEIVPSDEKSQAEGSSGFLETTKQLAHTDGEQHDLDKSLCSEEGQSPMEKGTKVKRSLILMSKKTFKKDKGILCRKNPKIEHGLQGVDAYYNNVRAELDSVAHDFEVESWSLAVDQHFKKKHSKEVIKQQNVIYGMSLGFVVNQLQREIHRQWNPCQRKLIQTEVRYVRALKIIYLVYVHELRETLKLDKSRLDCLFPQLENLLELHNHFLSRLRERRQGTLEPGSERNYVISSVADILIDQFSGELGEQMKESYSVFCSHYIEALNYYTEQLQCNKKFRNHITKIKEMSIVRQLGIPEYNLLVMQRITKYPVLLERMLKYTEADSAEHKELAQALGLIKGAIVQVDAQINLCKKESRLKEIAARMDPKEFCRTGKDGRIFRREDMTQGKRRLLHEGRVTWKAASGRLKDILAVLLTDVLLLLKDKDQRYVFSSLDGKPPVISLQKLIIRELEHEEKAMLLISASNEDEKYEIHTSSKEERNTWITHICQAINSCPHTEERPFNEEQGAQQQSLRGIKECAFKFYKRCKHLLPAYSTSTKKEDFAQTTQAAAHACGQDAYYNNVRVELDLMAQDFEVESWSLAVDQHFKKKHSKEVIKQQNVIYELIQTEVRYVRTLMIIHLVYVHELRETLKLDKSRLDCLFPQLENLLELHNHFLSRLQERRQGTLEPGSERNYVITSVTDILSDQFTGDLGERMKESYIMFYSHCTKALNNYTEQLQRNKKFRVHIMKIKEMSIVRQLGIPEYNLLVMQRLTKYPIVMERMLKYTEADSEEHKELARVVGLLKGAILQVEAQVNLYEKGSRLREIAARMDPKAFSKICKDGCIFRRENITQGKRRLLHEGRVYLKANSGRLKDILAVLLTDVLLLLQDKDQRYVFSAVDGKPSVISLQKLIVRELEHEEKAMLLISASNEDEKYEIHTSSKEERYTWITHICQAVDRLRRLFTKEDTAGLQRFREIQDPEPKGMCSNQGLEEDVLQLSSLSSAESLQDTYIVIKQEKQRNLWKQFEEMAYFKRGQKQQHQKQENVCKNLKETGIAEAEADIPPGPGEVTSIHTVYGGESHVAQEDAETQHGTQHPTSP